MCRTSARICRAQEVRVALRGATPRSLAALAPHRSSSSGRSQKRHAAFAGGSQGTRPGLRAEADLALHASIAEASGNDFYLGVLESIHESISGFMRLTLNLTRTGSRQRAQRVVDEHAAILDAIREQDSERARVAMQFHLGQARHRPVDRRRD